MRRMKVLAGLLALTVSVPGLSLADPQHDDWNPREDRFGQSQRSDRDARRAYNEGWRDAMRRNQRDDRSRRDDRRRDRSDDRRRNEDDRRTGRDDLSPADIIIPLLLR